MREINSTEKKNWLSASTWLRGLFMLLFGFIAGFTRFIITLIAIFQFLSLLATGRGNTHLKSFGESLNNYIYHINQFLTLNTDKYPFPLSSWPEEKPHYRYTPRD
ncbi:MULTISPECIES: DUF4389 domain-containing protein [Thalassotalea]|uniref:DUF4389 domain-containing protein n=1 Tax=Thalassotalea TaxID=1518149 RepID=UPI000945CFD6|nr:MULTISPECIES: DUF4389 domain-containing protein [Thalassotalea]OKY27313.1 hypothetical protein BI291_00335 [Thalassotalea sp. PP2-459]